MSTPPAATMREPISRRTTWTLPLPLLFGLVVVAFGGATALTELRAAAIDRYATDIAEHSAPATEQLSEARRDLVLLRAQLRDALDATGRVETVDFHAVDDLAPVV